MGESLEWRGKGFCGSSIESQFKLYKYPASGYSPIGMYYRYGGSYLGTMTESNRLARAYREGDVPFVVNQNVWFEGETRFADIILPACTNLERWDIAEWANCSGYVTDSYTMCNHRVIVLQKKCIEPLGESKSDYQIFAELAKRLGIWAIFTDGGKTEYDWVKQSFAASDLPKHITWEEFEKKGYFVVPPRPAGEDVHSRLPLVRGGPGARHARLGPPPGRHGRSQRVCRPRRARSSSSPPASPASRRPTAPIPSARSWGRSTWRAGRATAPRRWSRSTRCR